MPIREFEFDLSTESRDNCKDAETEAKTKYPNGQITEIKIEERNGKRTGVVYIQI